jgi:hypothetical protein
VLRQVALAEAGTPVAETCGALGISRSSYYAALRAARLEALPREAAAA